MLHGICNTDANRQPSQTFRSLFLQESIKRGILAPSFIVSYSNSVEDITKTINAVDQALGVYKKALNMVAISIYLEIQQSRFLENSIGNRRNDQKEISSTVVVQLVA